MEKLVEKLQKRLMPLANKLASYKFLSALGHSFQILLPIILIGSFAVLLAFLNFAPWQSFLTTSGLQPILMNVFWLTLGIIAFYMILVLPYYYGKELDLNPITTVILSVMAFLIITPTTLFTAIPTQWFGYAGLLGTMLVTFLVTRFVKLCLDKNIYIHMPEGIPSFVEDAFASLVPALLVVIIAVLVAFGFSKTSFGNFHAVIYQLIQTPLQGFGLSFPAYLVVQFLCTLFMFSGVHGQTIFGIIEPLTMAASAQNLAAFTAGTPLPNIITQSFSVFCQPGGIGATFGLAFLLAFGAKSKRLKTLGKIALIPAIFGINEPLIFGIPILLSPLLFIPYVLGPLVATTLSYVAIAIGIVPRLSGVVVHWTMPQVISGFMAQGWQAAVLQVVIILVTTMIWYPFFKITDKNAVEEESKA